LDIELEFAGVVLALGATVLAVVPTVLAWLDVALAFAGLVLALGATVLALFFIGLVVLACVLVVFDREVLAVGPTTPLRTPTLPVRTDPTAGTIGLATRAPT
jgi:uncharacterized membrane protein